MTVAAERAERRGASNRKPKITQTPDDAPPLHRLLSPQNAQTSKSTRQSERSSGFVLCVLRALCFLQVLYCSRKPVDNGSARLGTIDGLDVSKEEKTSPVAKRICGKRYRKVRQTHQFFVAVGEKGQEELVFHQHIREGPRG